MGTHSGAGKIYFILYLAVILELLLVIVDRDDAEDLLIKRREEIVQAFKEVLSNLAEKPSATPQQEVVKYYVDASEGGTFNPTELPEIPITLKGVSEKAILDTINIDKIYFIPTKGSLTILNDKEIKEALSDKDVQEYDKSKFSFDFGKYYKPGRFISIPLISNTQYTGYYKFIISSRLHKVTIDGEGKSREVRIGKFKVPQEDLSKTLDVNKFANEWNNPKDTIFIAIVNKRIPPPPIPDPVSSDPLKGKN
jgi:hypothetical protein